MQKFERSAQARRELDRRFAAADGSALEARPHAGWIRAIRAALGMTQAALAERLGVSRPAVNKLERAERAGHITLAKLDEVAAALGCHVVYALVPNTSLEDTVRLQARAVAASELGYVARTMELEAQAIDDLENEALERQADRVITSGRQWSSPATGAV